MEKKGDPEQDMYIFIKSFSLSADTKEERRQIEETIAWLQENFYICDSGSLLKASVFQDYVQMCRERGWRPKMASVFGRYVHKAFPNIKSVRRGGVGGAAKHHYRSLRKRTQSGLPDSGRSHSPTSLNLQNLHLNLSPIVHQPSPPLPSSPQPSQHQFSPPQSQQHFVTPITSPSTPHSPFSYPIPPPTPRHIFCQRSESDPLPGRRVSSYMGWGAIPVCVPPSSPGLVSGPSAGFSSPERAQRSRSIDSGEKTDKEHQVQDSRPLPTMPDGGINFLDAFSGFGWGSRGQGARYFSDGELDRDDADM